MENLRKSFESIFEIPPNCAFDTKKQKYVGNGFGYSQKRITDYNLRFAGFKACSSLVAECIERYKPYGYEYGYESDYDRGKVDGKDYMYDDIVVELKYNGVIPS